ncbi:MAG: TetR/AcrR family transcriptional regulator [Solirubrobacteraceae bacterium]|jgi:AcrR family transcriptional regulator
MTPPAPQPQPASQRPDRPATRPYLRAADRRRQLLDAAARIAGREGLERLSMVGVAAEAAVSRQLVYEHFSDLSSLVMAMLIDRFGDYDAKVTRAIGDTDASGLDAALLAAGELLSLPAQERHILRVLLAYAGIPRHELSFLAHRLRARSMDRWTGLLETPDDPRSRALTWAVVNALFGLGDLVDAGEITVQQGLEEFRLLVVAAAPELS